ncbi:MAG TPA: LuxR C-terminal-related transcriptional regulator [Gemmatimonadaceae bacterium]|jgi:LuxR family maltose regulon positive regulatory protein|nr:LuxR C-terminal-related transcriptional regulator [Gemmatimonadaceae bacterium]
MSRALALVDSAIEPRTHERAAVAPPFLETKLYVPRTRSGLVPRPRLIDALRQAGEQKLTIVVAPAGFGKTTLLGGWVLDTFGADAGAAWVSLDATENEPSVFWAYFITAVARVHPGVGQSAMSQLRSAHPAPIESILATFINEIEALGRTLTVILDDYHVIDALSIHETMTFLLDRMPPRMHLVIASRSDPPLALPRLRARGELTELHAAQLRFTLDEASAFLRLMSLNLSPDDTARLERRTEGWIAGLKLAALSMKGREDARGFVDAFSGNNRFIADYLVEEVLQSQPEHVTRFLLATAILDRLSGPLCDALTGARDGQIMLEDLERKNLFVVALDDAREWYRYHHLFADVLQKQARLRDPDGIRTVHRRASIWHEAHGSRLAAVRHAFGAEDLARAADLLEHSWPEKNRSYESREWLDQVKTLPDAAVRSRPTLSMGYAWALLNSGELEAAEPRLGDVELWLQSNSESSEEERLRSLRSELAAARVYLTQSLGQIPGTLEHAQRALELSAGDDAARATGTALIALAHWGRGELEAAHQTFSEALTLMRDCGHGADVIRGTFVLGDIRVAQGRLREAARVYENGLRLAAEEVYAAPPETDELYLGLSEVHREWNDIDRATELLEAVTRAAPRTAHVGNRLRWCTAMAGVRAARGDVDGALDLLDEAGRNERRDPVPRTRPIPAVKARIHIAQGRLDEAAHWALLAQVSADDDPGFLREFEHLTLVRLLIARHERTRDERSLKDAARLLERLDMTARTGKRAGSVIEILVLESLVQSALNNVRGALDLLAQAIAMAEPEGFLRLFLDHGSRMRDLLRHAMTRGLAAEYTRRVLAAFDAPHPKRAATATAAVRPPAGDSGMIQPLTTRELEILRLIASGLRNQEIAGHLAISAATVKRHIANAYGKLGAAHRTEALNRAKELELL